MIDKKALCTVYLEAEASLEYEITEHWLEDNIELQLKRHAKAGKTEYEFVVHTSQINPSMVRKVLTDKGYDVLWWPEPVDAKPPYTRMKIRVKW